MKLSQQIYQLIDVIRDQGWTQGPAGWYQNGAFGVEAGICLEGGIMAIAGISPTLGSAEGVVRSKLLDCPLYTTVLDAANKKYAKEISWLAAGCSFSCLYMHNDHIFRNETQVIEFLFEVAEEQEKKELREEKEATAGFIGDDPSEIEFEPLHTTPPATEPIPASPEPVETPEKEPVGV